MRILLPAEPLRLGHYPTALERIDPQFSRAPIQNEANELWVKRDDRTHDVYGGNKVRKLEWVLADARARGATRLVTIGAAGSHHVLATTYFGRRAGFEVEAVLVPQPRTPHVVDILRADLALGLRSFPVGSWAAVPWMAARRVMAGARFVTVGGSSILGSMGYASAAREFANQVRAGEMPEPDVCVVALGSGGTAAGLAAGFAHEGLATRVVGICVSRPPAVLRWASWFLARACLRRASAWFGDAPRSVYSPTIARLRPQLSIETRFLGKGYGHATPEGEKAAMIARSAGLVLDPTYTAKAFAAALALVREGVRPLASADSKPGRVILYWHTLSSAPMEPLLENAPEESELAPALRRLLSSPAAGRT